MHIYSDKSTASSIILLVSLVKLREREEKKERKCEERRGRRCEGEIA
jgi:hypothetical protein